jgi:hypothetical protein
MNILTSTSSASRSFYSYTYHIDHYFASCTIFLSPLCHTAGITVATKLASDDLVVQEQLANIYNEMGAAYLKSAPAHKAEEMFIKAIKLYHGLKMYTGR